MAFSENVEEILRGAISSIVANAARGLEKRATFSDIVAGTKQTLDMLGCRLLEQVFDEIEAGYNSTRDKHRVIVRNKNKSRNILTSLGEITLKHTLYYDKDAARYFFAVDELLQLEKYSRIEQNLQAKLVGDATLTSYGKASALSDGAVSRQTVFNLIKRLKTIEAPHPKTEREAKNIYIEADEDHIHLNDGSPAEMKLVYVHEGRENTKERVTLINPRYFVSADADPDQIWNDVSDYILTNYRATRARVHLSGDGAPWIKAGTRIMPHVEYHLDKYHLQKAIINIARGDKKAQSRIRRAVYDGRKDIFQSETQTVFNSLTDAKARKSIGDSYLYVRGNLDYISRDNRCSAEGHVSHVLSARLSSRPMAWSRAGAERMAKLRAYLFNNGDFVQLVRFGKVASDDTMMYNQSRYNLPLDWKNGIEGAEITPTYSFAGLTNCRSELALKLKQVINN